MCKVWIGSDREWKLDRRKEDNYERDAWRGRERKIVKKCLRKERWRLEGGNVEKFLNVWMVKRWKLEKKDVNAHKI